MEKVAKKRNKQTKAKAKKDDWKLKGGRCASLQKETKSGRLASRNHMSACHQQFKKKNVACRDQGLLVIQEVIQEEGLQKDSGDEYVR